MTTHPAVTINRRLAYERSLSRASSTVVTTPEKMSELRFSRSYNSSVVFIDAKGNSGVMTKGALVWHPSDEPLDVGKVTTITNLTYPVIVFSTAASFNGNDFVAYGVQNVTDSTVNPAESIEEAAAIVADHQARHCFDYRVVSSQDGETWKSH